MDLGGSWGCFGGHLGGSWTGFGGFVRNLAWILGFWRIWEGFWRDRENSWGVLGGSRGT